MAKEGLVWPLQCSTVVPLNLQRSRVSSSLFTTRCRLPTSCVYFKLTTATMRIDSRDPSAALQVWYDFCSEPVRVWCGAISHCKALRRRSIFFAHGCKHSTSLAGIGNSLTPVCRRKETKIRDGTILRRLCCIYRARVHAPLRVRCSIRPRVRPHLAPQESGESVLRESYDATDGCR